MKEIVNISWRIFISQYIGGRMEINKEAPFQHHLASIIKEVGQLYTITKNEFFFVDLETKCENIKGKNKYLDITCGFRDKISCAIEMKFKTKKQGAQDHGRIDVYQDIEAIELSLENGFDLGFFFMITDSTAYIKPSKKGVGVSFPIHQNKMINPGKYHHDSKGREHVHVNIKGEYLVNWYQLNKKYFLMLGVTKKLKAV